MSGHTPRGFPEQRRILPPMKHIRTLAFLLLASTALAQNDPAVVLNFKPSKDMPQLRNPSGHAVALGGMCNGIDEWTNVYYRSRQDWPGCPSMADVSQQIKSRYGEAYFKSLMETAQYMSLAGGLTRARLDYAAKEPTAFSQELADRLAANRQPVSLGMNGPAGLHRVSAYGCRKDGNQWVFRIADSNHPDDDNLEMRYDSTNHQWKTYSQGAVVTTWTSGDLIRSAVTYPIEYNQLVLMGLQGKPIAELRSQVHYSEVLPPNGAFIQKLPKAGGVILQVNPGIFSEASSPVTDFLADPQPGVLLLNQHPADIQLSMVPLREIAATGDLRLTSVRGFVQHPDGAILLVGEKVAGQAAIPSSYLSVALASLYLAGTEPFVSLDPDPENYSGPQHVRVGGLPDSVKQTPMVQAMLEADYLMKKINLGKESPKIDGFRRWCDILDEQGLQGASRMWLSPAPFEAGDYRVWRSAEGVACYFHCRPRVQAEQERLQQAGLDVAAVDEAQNQAARSFTEHYREMEEVYPAFVRLRQVFEVATLAAALREQGIHSSQLESFSAAGHATIPASYPGIGPDLTNHGLLISGGAEAAPQVATESAAPSSALSPLLQASAGSVTLRFPALERLTEKDGEGLARAAMRQEAVEALQQGDLGLVHRDCTTLLAEQSDDLDARATEATAFALENQPRKARSLLAPASSARDLALRAWVEARDDDSASAESDLQAARRLDSTSPAVLMLEVQSRLQMLDLSGAGVALRDLARVVPGHPCLPALDQQIGNLKRMEPAGARQWVMLLRQLPAQLAIALQGHDVVRILGRLENGELHAPPGLYVAERLRLALAFKALKEPEPALSAAERLVDEHPDWNSAYLARCFARMAQQAPLVDILSDMRALQTHSQPDPLSDTCRAVLGVQHFGALLPALYLVEHPQLTGADRDTLLQLAVDGSPVGPGRTFFERVQHPDQSLLRGIDLSRPNDAGQQWLLFDHLTEGMDGLQPDDPAWLFAFSVCVAPMQELSGNTRAAAPDAEQEAAYQSLINKALRLAGQESPCNELPMPAKLRSIAWLQAATETMRQSYSPDSRALAPVMATSAATTRLTSPESAGDSLESVRSQIERTAQAVDGFLTLRKEYEEARLLEIARMGGTGSAARVHFALLMLEHTVSPDTEGQCGKLANLHPGLEGSPELRHLRQGMHAMTPGQSNLEAAWNDCFSGLRTRYDVAGVDTLLEALNGPCKGQEEFLGRCRLQCRQRLQLGMLESSSDK